MDGGFWGPPTSSVDWCESNYVHTRYVAETYNTLSNAPGVVWALVGLYRATERWRTGRRDGAWQPGAVLLCYLCPLVVYLGSMAFHATLTAAGQAADEIPMIIGVLQLHYALAPSPTSMRACACLCLAVFLCMFMLPASPLPLQLSYAAFVGGLVFRSISIARARHGSLPMLLKYSLFSYLAGAVLWISEQLTCPRFRAWQFHAWWHVLTAIGTCVWIQFAAFESLHPADKTGAELRMTAAAGLPLYVSIK